MRNHPKFSTIGRWLSLALSLAAVLWVLSAPPAVGAQDYDRLSCSSDGGRVACDADTSGGVRMTRQYSGSRPCIEGSTWGFNERGVWVDRGCSAEFALTVRRSYTRIEPGTEIAVRTNDYIRSDRRDNRVYYGTVDQDVYGSNGRLAVPRGAQVEMMVRTAPDNDLVLDLESVNINGQRYALSTESERIESERRSGLGGNRRTGEYVGGGAILGSIIGAIAGGGKGAAIGAAAGAAAGAGTQVITRGREIHVPPESLLNFRIDQPLVLGVPDRGVNRDGYHYHD